MSAAYAVVVVQPEFTVIIVIAVAVINIVVIGTWDFTMHSGHFCISDVIFEAPGYAS